MRQDRTPDCRPRVPQAALLLLLALSPLSAAAQVAVPSPIISLDGETPPPAGPSPMAVAASEAVAAARDSGVAAPPEPPLPFIAPLAPRDTGWTGRLVGDTASAHFSLDVPQGTTVQALRIAYRSAIDVLPEQSSLTVSVNGVALSAFAPRTADGLGIVDLPAELLRPGSNDIGIDAVHHHRIYCGADSSFALWSEIDLAQSGAVLPGFTPPADPQGFRSAMLRQLASPYPLEIRAAPGVPQETALAVATAATRAGGIAGSGLRLASVWSPAGGAVTHARITIVTGASQAADVRRGGDGALVLRLVSTGGLPEHLADILPAARAPEAFALLEPGAARTFESLGAQTVALAGRFAAHAMRFRLPDDWLTLTTRPARLTLHYRAADDLPDGSRLNVRLNGRAIQLLPLDSAAKPRPMVEIDFQAQLLRAGVNALEFEVLVPGDPPDMPCPGPVTSAVTIDGASTLLVPPSPRMTLPGMATAVDAIDGANLALAGEMTGSMVAGLTRLALMQPLSGSTPVHLTVMRVGDVALPQPNPLGLTRAAILEALTPPIQRPGEGARSGSDTLSRLPDARALLDTLMAWTGRLDDRPLERSLVLGAWLERTRGVALMMQPVADDPSALWLVLAPGADLAAVAGSLEEARRSGRGPGGRLSVLDAVGVWHNWYGPGDGPSLLGPLTLANARDTAGAYASWSPVVFTMGGVGAAWASALVGVVLVRVSREKGKR